MRKILRRMWRSIWAGVVGGAVGSVFTTIAVGWKQGLMGFSAVLALLVTLHFIFEFFNPSSER
jgi:hypothetical protein